MAVSDDNYPADWDRDEIEMFETLADDREVILTDEHAQELFDLALFDFRGTRDEMDAAHLELINYMWDHYHINFNQEMDWNQYREWYDSTE